MNNEYIIRLELKELIRKNPNPDKCDIQTLVLITDKIYLLEDLTKNSIDDLIRQFYTTTL
jgi:hypothetical protein